MRFQRNQFIQAGDTIVEVLIAIAVVSSVLAGAFTVSQKSAVAVRDSQERGEVLQLLNSQIELVRAAAMRAATTADTPFVPSGGYFCMNSAGERKEITGMTDPGNLNEYIAPCKGLGPGGFYNVAIRYLPASKVFEANGRWAGLTGSKAAMTLQYKVYPGLAINDIPALPTLARAHRHSSGFVSNG